jgi:hypothetical protein
MKVTRWGVLRFAEVRSSLRELRWSLWCGGPTAGHRPPRGPRHACLRSHVGVLGLWEARPRSELSPPMTPPLCPPARRGKVASCVDTHASSSFGAAGSGEHGHRPRRPERPLATTPEPPARGGMWRRFPPACGGTEGGAIRFAHRPPTRTLAVLLQGPAGRIDEGGIGRERRSGPIEPSPPHLRQGHMCALLSQWRSHRRSNVPGEAGGCATCCRESAGVTATPHPPLTRATCR